MKHELQGIVRRVEVVHAKKQSYAAGVLRPVGEKPQVEKIERCDDGKWVAHLVRG